MTKPVSKRRRLLRVLLISLFIWVLVGCGLAAAVHFYGQTERAQAADVIIVLGSGLRRDNQPGLSLVRRSEKAAALYREGLAPFIICTGGTAQGRTRSEASGCEQVLLANGVPAEAIILEEHSRSTEENALFSHQIMDARGWQDAVIVSDGYHLLRAQWIFALEGIPASPSPAFTRPRLLIYGQSVAREVLALHWQLIQEIFNLPVTNVPLI